MLNLLVANQKYEESEKICNLFIDNNDIKISKSYTGIETLDKYQKLSPNILILDTGFKDTSCIDIINELSLQYFEEIKSNLIITINDRHDLYGLEDAEKVHKFFDKPINYNKMEDTVNKLKKRFEIKNLDEADLTRTLIQYNFHMSTEGAKYMQEDIIQSYYHYPKVYSLDELYKNISKKMKTTSKKVCDGMRSSLIPVNNFRKYNTQPTILDNFAENYYVPPRDFISVFVADLYNQKNKK